MRKMVAVLCILGCVVSMAACGGSSSTATNVTTYNVPTAFALPSQTQMGGSIQGTVPVFGATPAATLIAGGPVGLSDTSPGAFNRPIAVTTDGTNLYVADYFNNAIRRINIATQVVTTIAGNTSGIAGSLDNASGTSATTAYFNRPSGITIDQNNNLYVTDSGNFTIRKIDLIANVVTTLAGLAGTPGSIDAPVPGNARFNLLNGITTDGKNLYVTDSNNTVRRIDLVNGSAVSTLAGAPGTTGSADGPQSIARFNNPQRLTTDGASLYVTDFGNSTIRRIVLATGAVSTIAGLTGPGGAAGSHADSSVADPTGQSARFNQPNGITCDGINLYVTDSYDNQVRKIVLSSGTVFSGPVSTLLTNGTAANNTTVGITTNGVSLFVTDMSTNNLTHRILEIK